MEDQKKDYGKKLVGICRYEKTLCLNCAGLKSVRETAEINKIRRKDLEDKEFNYCERCGKPLT